MINSLRGMRRRRGIYVLVAITWLPYIATRCIESSATGKDCDLVRQGMRADHGGDDHHHPPPPGSASDHDHPHKGTPHRTCCELTGKCDVRTTPFVSFAAPTVVTAVALVLHAPPPLPCQAQHRPPVAVAHAPPIYLRHATLLI